MLPILCGSMEGPPKRTNVASKPRLDYCPVVATLTRVAYTTQQRQSNAGIVLSCYPGRTDVLGLLPKGPGNVSS